MNEFRVATVAGHSPAKKSMLNMEKKSMNNQMKNMKMILFCAFLICSHHLLAKSYEGGYGGGHKHDYTNVFEGLKGKHVKDLTKEIHNTIDSDRIGFPQKVREAFPGIKRGGNHRLLGHWGFEGAIPFDHEPYKSALKNYPRKELAALWAKEVNRLTDLSMKVLGLPKQQAKAYCGIIYNTHLLGDWVPGYKELSALQTPKSVQKDLLKNCHRLFGNNSSFVKRISVKFSKIKVKNPQLVARETLNILYNEPIGKKFCNTWRTQLSSKGITYSDDVTFRNFKSLTKQIAKLHPSLTAKGSGYIDDMFRKSSNSQFDYQRSRKLAAKVINKKGLLQNVVIKGKVAKVLSIPISQVTLKNSPNLARFIGLEAGVLTFFFTEGMTVYSFAKGNITEEQFFIESAKNLTESILVGSAVYVAVSLGAGPAGWAVIGIGIGAAIVTNITFDYFVAHLKAPHFSIDDFLGKLPSAIQNRKTVWSIKQRNSVFEAMSSKKSLLDLDQGKQDLLDKRKSIFPN